MDTNPSTSLHHFHVGDLSSRLPSADEFAPLRIALDTWRNLGAENPDDKLLGYDKRSLLGIQAAAALRAKGLSELAIPLEEATLEWLYAKARGGEGDNFDSVFFYVANELGRHELRYPDLRLTQSVVALLDTIPRFEFPCYGAYHCAPFLAELVQQGQLFSAIKCVKWMPIQEQIQVVGDVYQALLRSAPHHAMPFLDAWIGSAPHLDSESVEAAAILIFLELNQLRRGEMGGVWDRVTTLATVEQKAAVLGGIASHFAQWSEGQYFPLMLGETVERLATILNQAEDLSDADKLEAWKLYREPLLATERALEALAYLANNSGRCDVTLTTELSVESLQSRGVSDPLWQATTARVLSDTGAEHRSKTLSTLVEHLSRFPTERWSHDSLAAIVTAVNRGACLRGVESAPLFDLGQIVLRRNRIDLALKLLPLIDSPVLNTAYSALIARAHHINGESTQADQMFAQCKDFIERWSIREEAKRRAEIEAELATFERNYRRNSGGSWSVSKVDLTPPLGANQSPPNTDPLKEALEQRRRYLEQQSGSNDTIFRMRLALAEQLSGARRSEAGQEMLKLAANTTSKDPSISSYRRFQVALAALASYQGGTIQELSSFTWPARLRSPSERLFTSIRNAVKRRNTHPVV